MTASHPPDVEALDHRVRMHVFTRTAETGAVPGTKELVDALGLSPAAVEDSLKRLAAGRVLVLSPSSTSIWMANPFSAIPTPFRVFAGGRRYYGNCIWDALGIPAILGADARVETPCGDCGEPMALEVRDGALARSEGVIYFGVPAARWWENIGYT